MEKKKKYDQIKFSPRLLRKAVEACRNTSKNKKETLANCSVKIETEEWSFDSVDEFLAEYAKENVEVSSLYIDWQYAKKFSLFFFHGSNEITIRSNTRAEIETIFSIFEEAPSEDKAPFRSSRKNNVTVFIGHGKTKQWEKLKSHLQDKHDIDVIAYETGARAGHTIRDILDSMSDESSIALLILTGEDKTETGVRARQNVIHECGLFQGKLGFERAIMLVEEGIELASNFDGIQQLRFKKGRISEVFGDVVATIRREFGPL
jgi:predicted nucleotide-binding protein